MSDTFTLELPDGRRLEGVPVGTTKEQIAAKLGAAAPKGSVVPEWLKETGRVADQTIRGGLTALPRLAKTIADATGGTKRFADMRKAMPDLYPPEAETKASLMELEQLMTPSKPQTKVGKALGNIGESAVGAVASPGGMAAPMKSLFVGGSAGAGSEGSAALFGDNAVSRILGGLVGGGAASLLSSPMTNQAQVARQALKDVDETDLRMAQGIMQEAAAKGTPLNLSQAMGRDSNIDKLVDVLANSKEGTRTVDMLRRQPAQVEGQMDQFLGRIPGQILPKSNMANQAQSGATNAIEAAKQQRTRLWESTLAKEQAKAARAGLPAEPGVADVQNLQAFFKNRAGTMPNTDQGAFLNNLAGKMVDDLGMPITDPKALNGILKEASSSLKMPNMNTPGIDAGASKNLANIINQGRDELGAAFAPIKSANAAYANFTANRLAPLKESSVGTIAQRTGAVEGVSAAEGKLFSMLNRGSDPNAKVSDISTLAKELRKAGEGEVFLNGTKSWMSDKLGNAVKETGGRGNEDIAQSIHKAFFETAKQKQGFRDMMAGVADVQGVPREQLVNGAEKFFDYVGRASRRPSNTAGISGEEFRRVAEGSLFGKLGQVSIITPLRQPVLKWVDWLRSDAYSAMDKLVTSPEGVDMLLKLAKEPSMSPGAVNAMATFLGTGAAAMRSEANNTPGVIPE